MSGTGQRRLQALVALIGLAGVAVSIYLTSVHYSAVQLVCSATGAVDCERVLSSGYGVIGGSGLPTAAAGILWFGVSMALGIARRRDPAARRPAWTQLAWSAIGMLTVVYLVFVEIVQLGAICIWCTAAHVLVLATFLLTVTVRPPASAPSP